MGGGALRAWALSHQKQRNRSNTEGAETQRKTEKGSGRGRQDTSLIYRCILWGEKFDAIALCVAPSHSSYNNVASFHLDQLGLPANWSDLIRDRHFIERMIRRKLSGEYTDRKGDAVEALNAPRVR
jgi:hypothetical protein